MTDECKWVETARRYIGEAEIHGPKHNPLILQMWRDIKRGGIKDDETPWCAAFVGSVLEQSGIQSTRFESARSYLDWGIELQEPAYGCVAVLTRDGGGHVGFVVGQNKAGDLMILGGNQSDAVNIKAFSRQRVASYRWPRGQSSVPQSLPIISAEHSTSEA
ncbi:TIGR02594 family protein [Enterobacter bugandensis]|uniref:TIGR02594 family protein n=1 Tax=Enterobacter bugandensis TaxID=881260 RepID=UPI0021D1510B|nr:TIGR02594 family protein [Enterobacter bugandensis]MCU6214451.1 TIGR02594 family protein [Enterobacter bugandensis]